MAKFEKSYLFLYPLLGLNYKLHLYDNFIGTHISQTKYNEYVLVLKFRTQYIMEKLEEEQAKLCGKDLIHYFYFDYNTIHTIRDIVLSKIEIDIVEIGININVHKEDIELFIQGRYSELSEGLKSAILRKFYADSVEVDGDFVSFERNNLSKILNPAFIDKNNLSKELNVNFEDIKEIISAPNLNIEYIPWNGN